MIKKILLSGLVCISLFSCSSDDDNAAENNNDANVEVDASLVGKWQLVGIEGGDDTQTEKFEKGCRGKSNIIFEVNKRFIDNDYIYIESIGVPNCTNDDTAGTWKTSNNILTFTTDRDPDEPEEEDQILVNDFTYKLTESNNKLTLVETDEEETITYFYTKI